MTDDAFVKEMRESLSKQQKIAEFDDLLQSPQPEVAYPEACSMWEALKEWTKNKVTEINLGLQFERAETTANAFAVSRIDQIARVEVIFNPPTASITYHGGRHGFHHTGSFAPRSQGDRLEYVRRGHAASAPVSMEELGQMFIRMAVNPEFQE